MHLPFPQSVSRLLHSARLHRKVVDESIKFSISKVVSASIKLNHFKQRAIASQRSRAFGVLPVEQPNDWAHDNTKN